MAAVLYRSPTRFSQTDSRGRRGAREELFSVLKSCHDRREARVMLVLAQLRLTRERFSNIHRDQFWKALLHDLNLASDEFAAADVFAAALGEITLYSIRCGRNPPPNAE
jgi:hypothetical protein